MAQYSRATLTDAGVQIARRMMDDDTITMTFTGIASGDGNYSTGEDITARTALKNQIQFFPLSSKKVTSDNVLHLKYIISNVNPDDTPLTVGYYVREIGIYAQVDSEPAVLYAIAIADSATADYLPEYDSLQPSTITMDWFLTVGNAENVSIAASPSAYALASDLAATNAVVVTKLTASGGDAADAKIGSSTASTASYPVPAANDTFKVILGKIIKFFADIKAAYTNVSVSGKTVTFTTAAGGTKQITTQDTTYSAGSGLSLSGTTFNHSNSVTAGTAGQSSASSGRSTLAVPYVTYDAQGHVTASGTHTHTINNFSAATASANGGVGLVPAPASANYNNRALMYLRSDGGWQYIPLQNNATTTAEHYALDARMGKTLNDKIDNIGTIYTGAMSSSKSCAANTWTAVASVTVPAGAYILFGRARCAVGNANKMFSVILGYGGTVGVMSSSMPVTIGTIGFSASTSDTFVVSSSTTFSISVFPNATMTIDAANITAIRVK